MANYYGTTVSEGGKLKKNCEEEVNKIIAKYEFGDEGELTVGIQNGELHVWEVDSCYAYNIDDEDRDEEVFDQFLEKISPFLVEPLIVSEVGSEKCCYVQAFAYIARPNKEVVSVSIWDAINRVLKIK